MRWRPAPRIVQESGIFELGGKSALEFMIPAPPVLSSSQQYKSILPPDALITKFNTAEVFENSFSAAFEAEPWGGLRRVIWGDSVLGTMLLIVGLPPLPPLPMV